MPDASWTKVISAGKPQKLQLGGEHGALELYAFNLKSGEQASLLCQGPTGPKLAVGRVSSRQPHCKVRGLLAEPVELSAFGGDVLVTGILKGGVYKTLTAGLAAKAEKGQKRAPSPEKAQPEKKAKTQDTPKKSEEKGKPAPAAQANGSAKDVIASGTVVVFSQAGCPFCVQAEQALKATGIIFKSVGIAPYRDQLAKMTGKTAAPSVWVKGMYIGGCNDGTKSWHGVKPMLKSGKLQEMVRGKKEEAPDAGPARQQLKGGLSFETLKKGNGPQATPGKTVQVRYDGRLAKNGKRFDKGAIKFRLGKGEVISGWDQGVNGMKVGEQRRLLIPAKLGYGARGAPPDIPAHADLIFEVELLNC